MYIYIYVLYFDVMSWSGTFPGDFQKTEKSTNKSTTNKHIQESNSNSIFICRIICQLVFSGGMTFLFLWKSPLCASWGRSIYIYTCACQYIYIYICCNQPQGAKTAEGRDGRAKPEARASARNRREGGATPGEAKQGGLGPGQRARTGAKRRGRTGGPEELHTYWVCKGWVQLATHKCIHTQLEHAVSTKMEGKMWWS